MHTTNYQVFVGLNLVFLLQHHTSMNKITTQMSLIIAVRQDNEININYLELLFFFALFIEQLRTNFNELVQNRLFYVQTFNMII